MILIIILIILYIVWTYKVKYNPVKHRIEIWLFVTSLIGIVILAKLIEITTIV